MFWQSIISLWEYATGYKLPFTAQEADLCCPVVRLETHPAKLFLQNGESYLPAFEGQVCHVINTEAEMEKRFFIAELLLASSFVGVGRKTAWGAGKVDVEFKVWAENIVMVR